MATAAERESWTDRFFVRFPRLSFLEDVISEVESSIIHSIGVVKKQVYKAIIDVAVLAFSVVALIVGLVVLLNRYVPIEYVLLVMGALGILYVVLGRNAPNR